MYKIFSSFTVIPAVYRAFIRNETTFTEYCLTSGALKSSEYDSAW